MQFSANGTQSVDFSSTVTGVTNGTFNGSGVTNVPSSGQLNSNAWEFAGFSDNPLPSYGGNYGTPGTDFARGTTNVAVTTGGLYAYTGAPGSASNPSLMVQPASNDLTPGTITLRLRNTSASSILNQVTVQYNLFCRNDEARAGFVKLQWSMDNVNYADAGVSYTSPGTADGLGWRLVQNTTQTQSTFTGFSVVAGGYFYIRWRIDDDPSTPSGSRDEFGLDDISVTASFVSCTMPPTTPSVINSISPVTGSYATVNFTRGNGTGGMLAIVSPAPFVGAPVNGMNYTENTNYGDGSALGNGYVVYFSNGVTAGLSGSFTITGLSLSQTYYVTLYEYNISGPCYNSSPATGSFTTLSSTNALATDYFRSAASGSWALPTVWEYSHDGLTWPGTSDLSPTKDAKGIFIRNGNVIDVKSNITLDKTLIQLGGTLRLLTGGVMNVYKGPGNNIEIQNGGVFQVLSNSQYSISMIYPGGTPTIAVLTGGIIRIGDGGSVGSGYYSIASGASPPTVWSTGAVFDWNTSETFGTASLTYFPGTPAATVPIFRISRTPALIPGANGATTWKGVVEINAPITFRYAGAKFFRNGITGSSTLTADATCGSFVIGDPSSETVDATLSIGAIHQNNAAPYQTTIQANCTTVVPNNISITSTDLTTGLMVNNGAILNCGPYIISGNGKFTLAGGGTLGIGHPSGITTVGTNDGNIQFNTTRSFNTAAIYRYYGTTNQVTGNGMPVTQGGLIIDNTGTAGNNTVTLTTSNSGSGKLDLTHGIFAIGSGQTYNIINTSPKTVTAANGSDFATGVNGGTLNFTNGGTITGTSTHPYRLYVGNGGLQCPSGASSVTIQSGGVFRINSGGWLNGIFTSSIYYAAGSTLEYNTGGSYNSSNEWVQNANGSGSRGGPANVSILTNTKLQLNASGNQYMTGNLLMYNGSSLALNTNTGRDFYIGGNWTRPGSASTFTHNSRKVIFNGSADQTITLTGGGVENYGSVQINKGGGTPGIKLILAAAPDATGISISGSPGATYGLEFLRGDLDLSANTMYFNTNYSNTQTNNIQIDGQSSNRVRHIVSTGGEGTISCFNFDAGNMRYVQIERLGATFGTLDLSSDVTLTTGGNNAGGIDFGADGSGNALVTINGIFQLNNYGFTINNPPNYGVGSYLIYNNGGDYRRNVEWQTSNPGMPYNVTVQNSGTHIYLNTAMNGTAPRTVQSTLRIMPGAILSMDGEAGNYYGDKLTVNDSVYIAGTLELAHDFGGDMYVGRDWKRVTGGVFTDHEREVEFFGSPISKIEAPGAETFSYLSVNKTGASYVRNLTDLNITRRLRIPGGTLRIENNDVNLKSDVNYTAYLDQVPAASSIYYNGSGRFRVERFIATGTGGYPYHGKAWFMLATPVNDAGGSNDQTIHEAWQEGQAPLVVGTPGLGTMITNNTAGSGGFDMVAGIAPSMKTYNPTTNGWSGISGTNIKLYNPNGYMIIIRGDRSVQTYNGTPNPTNMRIRGKVFAPNNPPPSVPVQAGLFASIGNPYAAPIKFSNLTRSNLKNVFYVWDPRITTGTWYGLGAYQTFTFDGTNYRVSPGGGSYGPLNSICDTIQSGQVFFVQSSGSAGSVSFSESAKAGGHRLVTRAPSPDWRTSHTRFLGTRVYVQYQGVKELIDGVTVQFSRSFSNGVDEMDAIKMTNTGENFSIKTDEKLLAAEKMSMPRNNDEIQYDLSQFRAMNYELEFLPENMNVQGLRAFLEDRYLNSYTPVSLTDTTWYSFSISATQSGSFAANRFRIVFKKRAIFKPVIQLYQVLLNGKQSLAWAPDQLLQDGVYTLKGYDGIRWHTLNSEPAGKSLYSTSIDELNSYSLYQVFYSDDEVESESNKVSVNDRAIESRDFLIYPNPVTDGMIRVQTAKQLAVGTSYTLYDMKGVLVQSGKPDQSGSAGTMLIQLPAVLSSGIYRLEISDGMKTLGSKQLVISR